MNRFIFALCCLLFAGCNSQKPEGNYLRVGIGAEVPTLDPQLVSDLQGLYLARGLFEGLVILDPKTLEPRPGLAEKWSVSDDGTVYTFTLRPNICYSDGNPILVEDFIFAVKRALQPKFASPTVDMIYPVKNAKAYYEGRTDWESVGIRAINENTLQITLERPVPYFLSLLSQPVWTPLSPKMIEPYGAFDSRDNSWAKPKHLISNGAFKLKSWQVGNCIEIEKNPNYYNAKKNLLDGVIFFPISDPHIEQNAFWRNELDITANIPLDELEQLHQKHPESTQEFSSLSCFYYIVNTEHPPLNDARVRMALSLAINREALCHLLHRDESFAAYALIPENTGGYQRSQKLFQRDIEKAKALLAEAGYPDGKNFPKLTLTFNTSDQHRMIAQAVQEMWRQELGISIQLHSEDWKSFLLTRRSGNFDIGRGGWIGDYNDPVTFLELFKSQSSSNYPHWKNSTFDLYLEQAESASINERLKIFEKAEALLIKNAPIIPLYFETYHHMVSPRVKNWMPNLLDYQLYQTLSLEEN